MHKRVNIIMALTYWTIGSAGFGQAYGPTSNPMASGGQGMSPDQMQQMNQMHQHPYQLPSYTPDRVAPSGLYGPSFGSLPNPSFMPGAPFGKNKGFASYGQLTKKPLPGVPVNKINGIELPPTTLDSFVRSAGGAAANIYGDEGTDYIPPLNGYGARNTINAGILGVNNQAITTGHGSLLPNASGTGWSMSGPRQPRVRRRPLPRHNNMGFQSTEDIPAQGTAQNNSTDIETISKPSKAAF